jgi:hypothetical protein
MRIYVSSHLSLCRQHEARHRPSQVRTADSTALVSERTHVAGPTWQSWPRRFTNCFANIDRVNRGDAPQWVVPELAGLPPRPIPSPQS